MRNNGKDPELKYDNFSVDKKVGFLEQGHKYVHVEKPDLNFTSVTTLIAQYKEKFDGEAVAKRVVEKEDSKYYGRDWKEVAMEWEDYRNLKAAEGTELHSYGEEEFNFQAYCNALLRGESPVVIPDNPKAEHAAAAIKDIFKRGYKLATTELLVYSEDVKVAGQSDILLKKPIKGEAGFDYMIYDWKFLSKPLAMKSFYTRAKGYKLMKGPFCQLMDCAWIHYSIQLALYQTLSGDPGKVTEKVLIIVRDNGYEFIPAYPMRVFWDQNDQLQCVHEAWNGKWWDSRMQEFYKKKPRDIVGI
jgi:hypothetical protein